MVRYSVPRMIQETRGELEPLGGGGGGGGVERLLSISTNADLNAFDRQPTDIHHT